MEYTVFLLLFSCHIRDRKNFVIQLDPLIFETTFKIKCVGLNSAQAVAKLLGSK